MNIYVRGPVPRREILFIFTFVDPALDCQTESLISQSVVDHKTLISQSVDRLLTVKMDPLGTLPLNPTVHVNLT